MSKLLSKHNFEPVYVTLACSARELTSPLRSFLPSPYFGRALSAHEACLKAKGFVSPSL